MAGDCWFWSADGLRSIKGAVGTEGAFEIVNPLSQPLQELVFDEGWGRSSSLFDDADPGTEVAPLQAEGAGA